VPQPNPQQLNRALASNPARLAGPGGCRLIGFVTCALLALAAGPVSVPEARADEAGVAADEPAGQAILTEQTSPLDEELAVKEAVAKTTTSEGPDPAPVPAPPENSSGEEALIELPITPAGTGQEEAEDPSAPADRVTRTSPGRPVHAEELERLRVLFTADGSAIDAAAESELLRLAGYLSHHQGQRVVLYAQADDSDQGSSHARRLSLSRALAVRTFLVDQGVPANRIYLRPLGSQVEDGPPDRVDILPLRP